MKKLLTVALAIGLMSVASMASAQLTIFVQPDGEAILTNTSSDPASFDSYQIQSSTDGLDVDGWRSIGDAVAGGAVADVIATLGAGALSFGEANPSAGSLADLNLGGTATLQAAGEWSLGMPFAGGDITGATAAGNINGAPSVNIPIEIVPEPASVVMAALALLGLVGYIRRR